jgi:hypothetical protein
MMPHRGGTTAVSSQVFGRDGARPSSSGCRVTLGGTCFRMSRTRRSASLRMNFGRIGLLTLACIANVTSAAEPMRDSDYDYDPPGAGSYSLPVIKPAADGALLDSNNKSVQLRDLTRANPRSQRRR